MADAGANKRAREPEEQRCRYLRFANLPHGCTAGELTALLEPLGKVEDCRVARASGGGMLALVEMSCTREATSAKRRLAEMPLRGSALTVSFDNSRGEHVQQGATAIGAPAIGAPPASGGAASGDGSKPPEGVKPPPPLPRQPVDSAAMFSKLPPFYVPDRMVNDVYDMRVVKMRSVLWTAREDDIRQFFRGITIERDAIEMGRDHAGRFSGMVYVRLRSTTDTNEALRRANHTLCGRSVIVSRLDTNTPGIFKPGTAPPGPYTGGMRVAESGSLAEPRPWPTGPAATPAPKVAAGHVGVHLTVGQADKGQGPSLQRALASAPVGESLAAVRHFLGHDPRLPLATRNAARFLDTLRTRILDEPSGSEGGDASATSPISVAKHLFRSPFEVAGVHGYSMPEIEHVFGTRSSDSVFWPIFSTFHTLLPHEVDDPTADESLEDFLAM